MTSHSFALILSFFLFFLITHLLEFALILAGRHSISRNGVGGDSNPPSELSFLGQGPDVLKECCSALPASSSPHSRLSSSQDPVLQEELTCGGQLAVRVLCGGFRPLTSSWKRSVLDILSVPLSSQNRKLSLQEHQGIFSFSTSFLTSLRIWGFPFSCLLP